MTTPTTVRLGQTLQVSLAENPTTGYSWDLTVSSGLRILNDQYVPPNAQLPGAGGIHTWKIKAVGVGNQLIHGIYRRPWEPITGKERQFFEHVNVIYQ